MNSQNVYFHVVTPSQTGDLPNIREGATIFIRVIEHTEDDRYTVAFSGGRFSVKSDIQLEVGSSHLVKISVNDGRIELQPQRNFQDSAKIYNLSQEMFGTSEMPDALSAYFTSLGLVPDATTMRLFSQMKTLGMKFNAGVLQKAWRTAQGFPENKESAADAALILHQKGIGINESIVNALLADLPFAKKNDERGNGSEDDDDSDGDGIYDDAEGLSPEEIKQFFLGVISGSYFSHDAKNKIGVLSFFNTLCRYDGKRDGSDWICVPFELSSSKNEAGNGKFRVFFGKNEKKIAINLFFYGKNYNFVLYFKEDKCSKIKFSLPDDILGDEQEKARACLEDAIGVKVELAPESLVSGFCPDEFPVSVIRGTA